MPTFLQDLRYGLRTLRRKPGFALGVILILALGIGANTAIFCVVNSLLLRPLPFTQPEQLVRVTGHLPGRNEPDGGVDVPLVYDLRERAGVFVDVSGLHNFSINLTGVSEPERVEAMMVSTSYFSLLGVRAAWGRTFLPEDHQPGNPPLAVISDGLWRRNFGADPQVIGKTLRLDNEWHTILGVMPPGFRHPGRGTEYKVDVWLPSGYSAGSWGDTPRRGRYILRNGVLARLKPGITLEAAQARLNLLAEELKREHPTEYSGSGEWRPRIIPLQEDLTGRTRSALLILLGAVGCVLLIACANVMNLLLARATARRREVAVRLALGATRARLIRQLLTESVIISFTGGLLGLLLTFWTIDLLRLLVPASLPQVTEINVDWRVLIFGLVVSLMTSLIAGLAPAIQATGVKLEALKDNSRTSTASASHKRLRHLLVVAEFALSLVLLIGAGLMMRSFWSLLNVPPGFNPDQVLTARIWIPSPNDPKNSPFFSQPEKRWAFLRESMTRVAALPGIQSASWTSRLPLDGDISSQLLSIEGRPAESFWQTSTESFISAPNYFQVMQIPLLRGRYFTDQDNNTAPHVAIISESFAARYFPNEDPLGKRFRFGASLNPSPWVTIIGIVGDVKNAGLEAHNMPQLYRCVWQVSSLSMALVARGSFDPSALKETVRRTVNQVGPDTPVFAVRTMNEVIAVSLAQKRFLLILLGLSAALALLLSSAGIYAVTAYVVTQRTHEIGIRMALGAQASDVFKLIIGQGVILALIGVGLGVMVALGLTRLMSSWLYGVTPTDPLTFIGVSSLLIAVALLACYLPARRAAKVDPMVALRYE